MSIGYVPPRWIPNPLHPLLPHFPDRQAREDAAWARAVSARYAALRAAQMATDGQVEKPAAEVLKEQTAAFAQGKRYLPSNAHTDDCECPRCKPGEWNNG